MSNQKQAEEAMVSINDTGHEEKEVSNDESGFSLKSVLWHGGSVYDAWFSCSSNQVLLHPVHDLKKRERTFSLTLTKKKWNFLFGGHRLLRFC